MPVLHSIAGRLFVALGTIIVLLPLLLGACSPAALDTAPGGGAAPSPTATPGMSSSEAHDGEGAHSSAAGAAVVGINMDIVNRATILRREDLQVKRGDLVSLHFTSDEPGEVHLHGYDLTAAVSPDAPGGLTFMADTAGAFGLNFHIFAADNTPSDGGGTPGGDNGSAANGHGGGSHGPLESEVPVSVGIVATTDDAGGVNVHIATEGWRWAPENVNEAHRPGEGHAHIYVDGTKVNRSYGPDYYLPGLAAGERRIRVTLNANSHQELTRDGQPLEAATVVTIPAAGHTHGQGHNEAHDPPPAAIDAGGMSVTAQAHPDPLGGYNLQVDTAGFVFAPENAGGPRRDGQGYGSVSIDGRPHARLYGGWHKLPVLAPGTHTIEVSLRANDGAPYYRDGRPVAASVMVEVSEGAEDGGGGKGRSHSDDGHGHDHGGNDADGDDGGREVVAEVHLGNLEVYP